MLHYDSLLRRPESHLVLVTLHYTGVDSILLTARGTHSREDLLLLRTREIWGSSRSTYLYYVYC